VVPLRGPRTPNSRTAAPGRDDCARNGTPNAGTSSRGRASAATLPGPRQPAAAAPARDGSTTRAAGTVRRSTAAGATGGSGAATRSTRTTGPAASAQPAPRRERAFRVAGPLRLVAGAEPRPPRTPFVVLMLGVLGGGLVGLLLLNSAAAADSFAQERLQQEAAALAVREQELGREVAAMEAPAALAVQARKLGLVPSGEPGFLVVDTDGSSRVLGTPTAATVPPPPPSPSPAAPARAARPTRAATPARPSPTAASPGTTATPTTRPGPVPTPTPRR
jgi:hypothetical protein